MSATVEQVQAAVAQVIEARERLLSRRTTDEIIQALATAAAQWLEPDSPWRARVVAEAPQPTGFSPQMVEEAVRLTFAPITPAALGELVDRELADRRALDGFCRLGSVTARATGPRVIAQFLAGNVPSPGIVSLCIGLILRAGNLVKLSSHDPVFPALFLESVRAVDPDLASCAVALSWPRTETAVTQAALAAADAIIAYGDDFTLRALKQMAPSSAVFLGYGHKVSFGVITRAALAAENLSALCEAVAFDVSVYDQQGCLSPHVLYVEERGEISPRKFCAALAEAMAAYHARVPTGPLTDEEAAQITTVRLGYEFRSETDKRVAVWASDRPNEWAVIYDDDPAFTPSCLNRIVFVKPTDGFKRVLSSVQRFASQIACVGVAPFDERAAEFAAQLARLGIHRVCPLGQMQRPPLSWHHEGRGRL
ncbi:MAG: hypothetical protein N3A53_00860, partial [Verrucomicrobiae bacterium]|nr:hypothetical protein [Verrucomicrobiae bacterium]